MPSLPHSRHRVSAVRSLLLVSVLPISGLLASGCATASTEPSLNELDPIVIETSRPDGQPAELIGDTGDTGDTVDTVEGGVSVDSDDKIIIRRATDRLSLDLVSLESRSFGEIDIAALEQAVGSKVNYAVHPSALSVKAGKNGHSLRQRFDPSTDGSPRVEFAAPIPEADDESWLSYRIYFEPRFEWNKGGKLPGLAGGTHPTFEGGDGTDGFSARLAWMPDGQMGVYLYHPDRPEELGELRGTFGTFQRKQWQQVTQRVVMNSLGQSDGVLQVWLDDLLVFSDKNMTWRTSGDFGADVFLYSAFYGGGSADWAPETTNYVRLADITVATTDPDLRS